MLNKEMFFISVVIPVYNVEKYLRQCLDSVLNQTYKNYEVILIDDGSTDKSGEICDEYQIKYDNIKVFHNKNAGVSASRNFGIEKASCDWLCFVDSDDVVHPKMLEYMVQGIKDSNAKACVCRNTAGDVPNANFFADKPYKLSKVTFTENILFDDGYFSYKVEDGVWLVRSMLIQKSIAIKYPMEVGRIYEDNAIALQWLYEAKEIAFIDTELYFYLQNPQSIMHQPLTHKTADCLWALEEQIKFAKHVGYNRFLELIYENYLGTAIYMAGRYNNENKDVEFAKKLLIDANHIQKKHFIKCYNENIIKYQREIKDLLHPTVKIIRKRFQHFLSKIKKK